VPFSSLSQAMLRLSLVRYTSAGDQMGRHISIMYLPEFLSTPCGPAPGQRGAHLPVQRQPQQLAHGVAASETMYGRWITDLIRQHSMVFPSTV
jgi:hypothetical protein